MKFKKSLSTIWERYLFLEALKTFLFFLGCFYTLYTVIDYSTHGQDFIINEKIQLSHIITYYGFMFIKRADLLMPLALLISSIKLLFSLSSHGELTALQASGISLKKIARPLIMLAGICTLFNYISFEFLLPTSLNFLDQFRQQHFKHTHRGIRKEPIHTLYLDDGSKIIYQTHDIKTNQFFDVFWICSSDEVWRMKYLSANPNDPVAFYVDHIQRNDQGHFNKTQSFQQHRFNPFYWAPDLTGKGHIPIENKKITQLFQSLYNSPHLSDVEKPQILSQLLFKTTMPLLSLLIIIGIFPYCVRYSRTRLLFPTYAFALFYFIAFSALLDACLILGEHHLVSPFLAILTPFLICFLKFGWKFKNTGMLK